MTGVRPSCREVTDQLDDYVADRMRTRRRAAVEGHLAACSACVAYLHSYRRTIAAVREAFAAGPRPLDAPEEIVAAVLEALRRRALRRADP